MYDDLDAYDHFRSERDYKQKVEQYNSLPDMEERRLMTERSNEAQPGNKRKLPYEWRDHDSKGPYFAKLPLFVMKEGSKFKTARAEPVRHSDLEIYRNRPGVVLAEYLMPEFLLGDCLFVDGGVMRKSYEGADGEVYFGNQVRGVA